MTEIIKKFLHMNAEDPRVVRISREILELALSFLEDANPDLLALMAARQGFLTTLYEDDVDRVYEVVEKHESDAVPALTFEFEHPDAGTVIAIVFRLLPGVDLRSLMNGIPEHLVN